MINRSQILTRLFLVCVFFGVSFPAGSLAESPGQHLYSTGSIMEVDRCASAWLIKRFIDQDAVFRLYSEQELITTGIVFDRPEAKLQRTHALATFEVIMSEYEIEDQRVQYLAELIHDIEINFWGKKDNPESRKLETDIQQLVKSKTNSEEALKACFDYLDQLY